MKKIKVTCQAAVNLPLDNLVPLQGGLKELSSKNFEKLKRSILKHGISFPFLTWESEGIVYLLDGHQRDRTLRKMAAEGFEIPLLPCSTVEARNRKAAAEKILLISSQYGKMTDESLEEFLAANDLSFIDVAGELKLPGIDERFFTDPNEFTGGSAAEQARLDQKTPATCPECGHQFLPR
jgi:hypothetical protein